MSAKFAHGTLDEIRRNFTPLIQNLDRIDMIPYRGKRGGLKDPRLDIFPSLPLRTGKLRHGTALFTSTSKMSCLSFSMPAGASMGSCPAEAIQRGSRNYTAGFDPAEVGNITADREKFICAYCYAGKSRFSWSGIQISQALRLEWVRRMLHSGGPKLFAEAMSVALDHAFSNTTERSSREESTEFFRIHDSGDFFDPAYYEGWTLVCENFPKVQFWAPTRQWVFRGHAPASKFASNPDWGATMSYVPDNLALRPSALHFNDPSPQIKDMAAGSTAGKIFSRDTADWDCPAYKHGGKTCAGALQGKPELQNYLLDTLGYHPGPDCRVCWVGKQLSVNYTAH